MIVISEFVAYDTTEKFYYLTEAGIEEYTGYDYIKSVWKNTDKTLLKMGRALHSLYTDNYHNNKPIYFKHRELIEYNIFKNENGERQAIINALAYMIDIQEDSDWFTMYLLGEVEFPKPIKNMLKNVNVLVYGEMKGYVPEDEYEVGY